MSSILDAAPTEIDRPKPLPVGSYICVVKGLPRYDKSSKKQTEFVEFVLQPIAVRDDVDAEELEAMGGFANKTIKATFYLTEDAVYRLDEFHEHCGIELEDGVSRRQRNEQTVNKQVGAFIRHEANQDGTAIFGRLGSTFIVE